MNQGESPQPSEPRAQLIEPRSCALCELAAPIHTIRRFIHTRLPISIGHAHMQTFTDTKINREVKGIRSQCPVRSSDVNVCVRM